MWKCSCTNATIPEFSKDLLACWGWRCCFRTSPWGLWHTQLLDYVDYSGSCQRQQSGGVLVTPPGRRYRCPWSQIWHPGRRCSGGRPISHIYLAERIGGGNGEGNMTYFAGPEMNSWAHLLLIYRTTIKRLYDSGILTVTSPGVAASLSDPDCISSGTAGSGKVWADDWSFLDYPVLTHLGRAVLCPRLITQPDLLSIHTVLTLWRWKQEKTSSLELKRQLHTQCCPVEAL